MSVVLLIHLRAAHSTCMTRLELGLDPQHRIFTARQKPRLACFQAQVTAALLLLIFELTIEADLAHSTSSICIRQRSQATRGSGVLHMRVKNAH